MIALDFYSGSHGHFLEYLINTYIFRGPKVKNILTDMGTCHGIRNDNDYMNFRIVEAGHYSEFNKIEKSPTRVVRISVESELENICYQINVFCRAGDIPAENKLMDIPQHIHASKHLLRNDLYSKLTNFGYKVPGNWSWNDIEYFVFPMSALYDLNKLYQHMYQLAHFLEHSFNPDDSLGELWHKFMEKNHGWLQWKKTVDLLEKSLCNVDYEFESSAWDQALLNYFLSKTVGINDGILHSDNDYPTNTSTIYQLIQQHINEFDQKNWYQT